MDKKAHSTQSQDRAFLAAEIGCGKVLREEKAWHFIGMKNRLALKIVSYGRKKSEWD